MGVGRVDDEDVHGGVDKLARALVGLLAGTDTRRHEQAPRAVLGSIGELLGLDKVLDGDEADELVAIIDDRKLLHLISGQQRQRLVLADTFLGHNQRHRRHNLRDGAGEIRLEAHVTVGADTHEDALLIDDRQARNPVPRAQRIDFVDSHVRGGSHGIGDHARLRTLHNLDLLRLVLSGQVAVEHADAALAGHADGHAGLGHRIHRRGGQRHAEANVAGELRRGIHLGGNDVGFCRKQQNVIEREAVECNLVGVVSAGVDVAHEGKALLN